MKIKLYTIPLQGGESLTEEMNIFLVSKKILQVENQLITNGNSSFWSFCIKYLEDNALTAVQDREKPKVDYREILDEATFLRFSQMRDIRKVLAQEAAVPPYIVFLDEELAGLAKLEELTLAKMKTVKGIGDKKLEKYGQRLLNLLKDAQS